MSSMSVPHTNGIADKLLDEARARVANGTAEDDDRLMVVMEALSARGIAATLNRKEYKIKILGKEMSINDVVFIFGFLVAGETGFLIFDKII